MKFNINKEILLPVLQTVNTIVGRRQDLPILSNVLFNLKPGLLTITAANLEIELVINIETALGETGEITLSERKLFDIFRALPDGATLQFEVKEDKTIIKSGKSRFTLVSLPAREYPVIKIKENITVFKIKQKILKSILENIQFSMAQKDVRYYLNGVLLELTKQVLRAVATDGHRLALDEVDIEVDTEEARQIIIPKKGVIELIRLLQDNDDEIDIEISENHVCVKTVNSCFTSKLIDGKFPDYQRVIPSLSKTPIIADRERLRDGLTRASILSNEKNRGVRMIINQNSIKAFTHTEQEEAEEELEVNYTGDKIEIGFNVFYLLDILTVIKSENVKLSILDPNSSCLVLPENESGCQYVVMPMRL